eukprot:scaffold11648_cov151-Skeletonema_marinoi.AAC.6
MKQRTEAFIENLTQYENCHFSQQSESELDQDTWTMSSNTAGQHTFHQASTQNAGPSLRRSGAFSVR